ncbi:MAG: hypothetical protein NTX96_03215 [Candidatus Zambryskibacteria bacterium]|nr:hypothetical protein [Candidatus Zambryskibacteria bacterium]
MYNIVMPSRFISRLFIIGILFLSFGFYTNAFAQTASTTQTINAEILSNVWYSTTTINEKDVINIYAGFQNHSDKNLSGTAGFYVDDVEIAKTDFTAGPKSLIKLETPYTAVAGNHKAQVKILSIKESSIDNLLASESEKKSLDVKYEITKEVVLAKAEDVANNVVNTINQYTDKLADYVESLKKPTESANSISKSTSQGKVLGTSTDNVLKNDKKPFSLYNSFIDVLVFLIHKWVWILAIIFLFIIYSIFKKD